MKVKSGHGQVEGPRFESQLGHHFSMVSPSLPFPGTIPSSVGKMKEMAPPCEMCCVKDQVEIAQLLKRMTWSKTDLV